MKIIVLGGGFIAGHLNKNYTRVSTRVPISELDVKKVIDQSRPDVIINCIAKTGRPNVDWCESNREETILANLTLPSIIAQECNRRGIHYLHIGSGCIFYGKSPSPNGWNEKDFANPESFYSKTKYACDLAIQDLENVCILRIRMPVSKNFESRNYLTKIFNYTSILDSANSMTFMEDLTRGVDWAIDKKKYGVYHLTNPEPISAVDFIRQYQEHPVVPKSSFKIINEAELSALTIAPRSNCIIDNSKIMNEGFYIRPSSEQVKEYISAYISNRYG